MTDMQEIEQLTRDYAEARDVLVAHVGKLQADIARLKGPAVPKIRKAVSEVGDAHARLMSALEESQPLFKKPKTRTINGVRIGFMKQKGKVVIANEGRTIELMRKLLPAQQAELLIKCSESVHKPSVCDLQASDLKRLGISITNDTDVVVIKPVDTDVDKLVGMLLADAEGGA